MRRGKRNKIIFLAPFQKDLFSAGQETGQCGLVPHLYCSQILWRTLRSSNQSEEHFSVASCLRWAVVKEESCFQVRVRILSTQIWMRSTKLSFTQIPLPFKQAKDHSWLSVETSVYQHVLSLFWKHLLIWFPQRIQIEIHLVPESGIFNSTGVCQPRFWQSCIFAPCTLLYFMPIKTGLSDFRHPQH